jgi:hypothetical protein
LRSIFRIFMPPRWSRRIAAYSSTFDICGMTRAFRRKHPDTALASAPVLSKLGFWLNSWMLLVIFTRWGEVCCPCLC